MIYLDNSATTKPFKSVLESFQHVSENFFANPSSIHHIGGEAEKLLEAAREQAAEVMQVEKEEIVFTSGGTEGNNLAIKGIALEHRTRGKHIITSQIEHPSVFDTCKELESLGFDITYLPVNENGIVRMESLEKSIRNDTILISIMHVNNELGSIQPIKEIGEIAQRYPKLYFHVDDVQGIGKVPLHLKNSGVDLCTISGHKIHGLNGTGILYVKKGTTLFPLFHGGSQERARRSGTENLAGNVSISKALRLIKESEKNNEKSLVELRQYLWAQLDKIDGVVINTPMENAAPHIVNISVPGIKPEVIIHSLGKENIFISTKSACSSKKSDESRVLASCGYNRERSISALRISMSYENTKEDISIFVIALEKAIDQLKKVME